MLDSRIFLRHELAIPWMNQRTLIELLSFHFYWSIIVLTQSLLLRGYSVLYWRAVGLDRHLSAHHMVWVFWALLAWVVWMV